MTYANERQARDAAQGFIRQLDRISKLSKSNPGVVRIASDAGGDSIAFWNDGTPKEFNISAISRALNAIQSQYPNAMRSRSGNTIRIELPL